MTFNLHEAMGQATIERPPPLYSVDDIVSAGRSLRRRQQRLRLATCAVAAVAAAAVTATVVVPGLASTGGPAPGGSAPGGPGAPPAAPATQSWPNLDQPFAYSFAGYDMGTLHVSDPMLATPGYQQAAVYLDGVTQGFDNVAYPSPVATLTLFRPGVFDPRRYQSGRTIRSGGLTGLAISNTYTVPDGTLRDRKYPTDPAKPARTVQRPAIAWRYADNAWATLVALKRLPEGWSAESLFALAGGLHPAAPSTPRVPFRMSYQPAGFHLVAVGADSPLNSFKDSVSALYFVKGDVSFTGLTDAYDPELLAKIVFRVHVYPTPASVQADPNNADHPNLAQPCDGGTFCDRPISAKYYAETSDLGDAAELRRIINGLTFDDIANPASWHDPVSSGAVR
jgi:hypothetical protein